MSSAKCTSLNCMPCLQRVVRGTSAGLPDCFTLTLTAHKMRQKAQHKQRSSRTKRHTVVQAAEHSNRAPRFASRQEHNRKQAECFAGSVEELNKAPQPVLQRLDRIAEAAPGLHGNSRVLDIGAGTGALIPHLQKRGIHEILAVDVTPQVLEALQQQFGSSNVTAGNAAQVRTWLGDVQSLPAYQAQFDAAFYNSVFGNVYDQRDDVLRTALLLKPGGHIIISHPLGRTWLNEQLHEKYPETVPHPLPDQAQLEALIADLPLQLVDYIDEAQLYIATLQVPENYRLQRGPIQLHGDVTSGFGRGSKQLGFATANLPPEPLAQQLAGLPKGVYLGWARLCSKDYPQADTEVHKMVMNIGQNPTVNPADAETTVELHVLHKFSKDFYGQPMRAIACGFIRPEMKFDGIQALIARIKTDAGIASKQLDTSDHQAHKTSAFLTE